MNPLIINNRQHLKRVIAQRCFIHDDIKWKPYIYKHKLIHRIEAAFIILQGKGLVVKAGAMNESNN